GSWPRGVHLHAVRTVAAQTPAEQHDHDLFVAIDQAHGDLLERLFRRDHSRSRVRIEASRQWSMPVRWTLAGLEPGPAAKCRGDLVAVVCQIELQAEVRAKGE